jgi:hypothetical protein
MTSARSRNLPRATCGPWLSPALHAVTRNTSPSYHSFATSALRCFFMDRGHDKCQTQRAPARGVRNYDYCSSVLQIGAAICALSPLLVYLTQNQHHYSVCDCPAYDPGLHPPPSIDQFRVSSLRDEIGASRATVSSHVYSWDVRCCRPQS